MPVLVDKALTDQAVKKLKPTGKRYEVKDSAVRGLGLRIAPGGSKTWFAMKRVGGKNVRATLGHYPLMSLAQARSDAAIVLNQMGQGTYAKGKSSGLFDDLFADWLKRDQAANRSRHEVERAMRKDAVPAWQGRHIDTITRPEIITLLDKVADRGAETHANRLRAYIKRFFTWCIERGELEHSPADKVPACKKETGRDRVLSEDELACLSPLKLGHYLLPTRRANNGSEASFRRRYFEVAA